MNGSASQRHGGQVSGCLRWWLVRGRKAVADDCDAVGFEVDDAVAVEVSLEDGFAQLHDEWPRFLGEESPDRSCVIDDQVVSGVALGADDLLIELGMKAGVGELGDRVVPGANGGKDQRHRRQSNSGGRFSARSLNALPVLE